ncbi:MAG: thermonuclease family protein [Alphaproteobacteria bacterium]
MPALIATPASADEIVGPARIIDGNRLEIGGKRLRLYGVRAPEPGAECLVAGGRQPCGQLARTALMDLAAGADIRCLPTGKAGPGTETVAICRAGGYDLSEGMAYTGWAVADREATDVYLGFERTARRRGHGMWRRARSGD